MAKHRLSFCRTTATCGAATVGLTALTIGLISWVLRQPGGLSLWTTYLLSSLVVLLTVPLVAVSGLAAAGGLIAVRRDSLEEEARPYASFAPREAKPSLLVGAIRAVFGRGLFGFLPGDWVEIRSLDEIMQTLDDDGMLDGLPFMAEMVPYCGRRVRVLRRVDKLNDWIHHTGLKRMHCLVLLEDLRCDGSAHGRCEAKCHLRWRDAWLRPAEREESPNKFPEPVETKQSQLAALAAFGARPIDTEAQIKYVCQVTQLTVSGTPLRMLDARHYARDFLSGNVRLKPFCIGIAIECFNRVQRMSGGAAFPHYDVGTTAVSPHETLNLQAGELVRVKPKKLIEPTLNNQSRNRGLWFDKEMLRFCGGEYRVKARVERIIIEKIGELCHLTNPCIILEGVTASGEYLGFNPENEYIFWREIWLERVAPAIA
jgi:hypothetical protein